MENFKYLLSDIKIIDKIGVKTSKLLKKKNINSIFDLILRLPIDKIDRSRAIKIKRNKRWAIKPKSEPKLDAVKRFFSSLFNLAGGVLNHIHKFWAIGIPQLSKKKLFI